MIIRKVLVTAVLMTMAMSVPAQAETVMQGPPGSEGTVLTAVTPEQMTQMFPQTQQQPAGNPQPEQQQQEAQPEQQSGVIIAGSAARGPGVTGPGQQGLGQPARTAQPDANSVQQPELVPIPDGQQGQPEQNQTQNTSGRCIDPAKPMVALTFDDGPYSRVGNQIMDCLAQYGGKATFFLVGERVAGAAAEVQRMAAEGHEIGNHTMNHKYLQKLDASAIQAQVNRCNDAIEATGGIRPKLMRLPGGNVNATIRANTGMPMIQWSIDTLDWKTRDTASTVNAVLSKVKDGDIILMHELYTATGNAVLQIVPELVNRGYQLVTVSEMAAAKGRTLQAGQLYSSF